MDEKEETLNRFMDWRWKRWWWEETRVDLERRWQWEMKIKNQMRRVREFESSLKLDCEVKQQIKTGGPAHIHVCWILSFDTFLWVNIGSD